MIDQAFLEAEAFYKTHVTESYKDITSLDATIAQFSEWLSEGFSIIPWISGTTNYYYWDDTLTENGRQYSMYLSFSSNDYLEDLQRALEDLTMARYRLLGGVGRNTPALIKEIRERGIMPFLREGDIRDVRFIRRRELRNQEVTKTFLATLSDYEDKEMGVDLRIYLLYRKGKEIEVSIQCGIKELYLSPKEEEVLIERLDKAERIGEILEAIEKGKPSFKETVRKEHADSRGADSKASERRPI